MCPDTPLSPQSPLHRPSTALGRVWLLLRLTGEGFIEDDDWSRGASIAYFTLFSVAPTLLVVIAVAGLAFGQDAAQDAIVGQLRGLMGQQTAEALEAMIRSASDRLSGTVATVAGLGAILLAISGVFGEVQSALVQMATGCNSTGSRWSPDAAEHTNWCKKASPRDRGREYGERRKTLLSCAATVAQSRFVTVTSTQPGCGAN